VFLVLLQVIDFGGCNELEQFALIFRSNILDGKDCGSLLVNNGAQSSLVLNDDVRYAHLAAKGWNEDDQFDGVNVIGNDDQIGLFGFDQCHAMIQTILDKERLLIVLLALHGCVTTLFRLGNLLSFFVEASLFLLTSLWSVSVEEAEEEGGCVLVQRVTKLGNGGRNL